MWPTREEAVPELPREGQFLANREVRLIPAGWRHPRDADGQPQPLLPDQMAAGAGATTEIMAYETVSEGTPISPAFPNTREGRLALVRYCAAHCTTYGRHRAGVEAWAAILFGRDASVGFDGTVHA